MMRHLSLVWLCGSLAAGTEVGSRRRSEKVPLSADEQYLAAFEDDLAPYRGNPIAERFIKLSNLVDVIPTWLIDIFIPLVIPKSTLSIPMKVRIPIPLDLGPIHGIPPGAAHVETTSFSINGLNEFKKLKPIKFNDDSQFTWGGNISWKKKKSTSIKIGAKLVIASKLSVNFNLGITVEAPAIDFALIMALDREKICNVWGNVFQSSEGCVAHPIFMKPDEGISGIKLAKLKLFATDLHLDKLEVDVLPLGMNHRVEAFLRDLLQTKKGDILAHISDSVSDGARVATNKAILAEVPLYHKFYPCKMEGDKKPVDVSEVCFTNNAAFSMRWGYANCPTHAQSMPTHTFPVDQVKCMNVSDIWPDAKPGQILRSKTEAIAGMHEIIDPALRYVPDSNIAGFQCDGTTFIYKCRMTSLAPIQRTATASAPQVCVLNHAGFVMFFDAKNLRTGEWVGRSHHFAINNRVCIDLSSGQEGDTFQTNVNAVGGMSLDMGRLIEYRKAAYDVTFECRGGTFTYKCHVAQQFYGNCMGANCTFSNNTLPTLLPTLVV